MRNHQRLAGLQARAKAATSRCGYSRVVVNRDTAAADDTETEGSSPSTVSAELWFYGTVGGYWWGFDSDDVADALRNLGDVDELLVRLHSFGGNAIEGIAIANLLANHPANVRIVVDGAACSAASMIALAGSELIMSPGSQLMVHDAWMWTAGNEAELLRDAAWIGKQSANYAETYAHRTDATAEAWREIMRANDGEGTWYSAQEAVEAGLADRVANIASTTPPPPMPDIADLEDGDLAAAAEWDMEILLHPAARAAFTTWRHDGALKPPSASAVGSPHTEGGSAVSLSDQAVTTLRTKLGVAGDADEATILAALDEALDERAEPTSTPEIPEGMTLISKDILGGLQTQAREGAEARAQQRTDARDQAIRAAVSQGRIAPAQVEHFTTLYDADPAGTQALIDKLEPGLIPVAELGHDQPPAKDTTATADVSDYAAGLGLTLEDLQ